MSDRRRNRAGRVTKENVAIAADAYARSAQRDGGDGSLTGRTADYRNAFKTELMAPVGHPDHAKRLQFDYVNWRGDLHQYTIRVEGVSFGAGGEHADCWMLNGLVDLRDGKPRAEFEVAQRRSFVFVDIKNLVEVE